MHDKLIDLAHAWYEAGSAVVLTGAGVSTESGLNDFTGNNALYKGAPVNVLLSRKFMIENTALFNEYCRERLYSPTACPNGFHKALAYWERVGLVTAVLTQNVDSLHQKAGSESVLELHGNMQKIYCDNCRKEVPIERVYSALHRINRCIYCEGPLRPSIILYGERLDEAMYKAALNYVDTLPFLIVAGTRMKVTAPLDIVERFKQHPGVCAYIGDTPPEDCDFDIVVEGKIGDITEALTEKLV